MTIDQPRTKFLVTISSPDGLIGDGVEVWAATAAEAEQLALATIPDHPAWDEGAWATNVQQIGRTA